jgi:hypothetical protein
MITTTGIMVPSSHAPSMLDDGLHPSTAVLVTGAAIGACVVVFMCGYALWLQARSGHAQRHPQTPRTEDRQQFHVDFTAPSLKERCGDWLQTLRSLHLRDTPYGVVTTVFYAVNIVLFWMALAYSRDNHGLAGAATEAAESADAPHPAEEFAESLMDVTYTPIFSVYVTMTVFAVGWLGLTHFAVVHGEGTITTADTLRIAVTIFTPSSFISFLGLIRALVYRCDPLDGHAICANPSGASRLLIQPLYFLAHSLCAFVLWKRMAAHNTSITYAVAATSFLVLYGLSVCLFNAVVIVTSPVGIDAGYFYIAVLKAMLTEIWVFQFLRVAIENIVHCLKHASHVHQDEEDEALHPLRRILAEDATMRGSRLHLLLGIRPPSHTATSHHQQQAQHAPSTRASERAPLLARDTSFTHHSDASPKQRPKNAIEHATLLAAFLGAEFLALIVLNGASGQPAVVEYGTSLVTQFTFVRLAFYIALDGYVIVRMRCFHVFKIIPLEQYAGPLVMNAFTLVLVLTPSVLEAQSHLKHWVIAMVNLLRFTTFILLLVLEPVTGIPIGRDVWISVALGIFLWTALTVETQLISENYNDEASTVETLRGVFTEIFMFETLSLALDRCYAVPEKAQDDDSDFAAAFTIGHMQDGTTGVNGKEAHRWLVCASPIALALISMVCHLITFGGVFSGDLPAAFLPVDAADPYVITASVVQIVSAVLFTIVVVRCSVRIKRAYGTSFVLGGIFLNFSVICSFLFLVFDFPVSSGNIFAATLQPLSDCALVVGSFVVWSADPIPAASDAELTQLRRWRYAGVFGQFALLVFHCVLGARAIAVASSLSSFQLFCLLRWCALTFALYEVFAYSCFVARPRDLAPPPTERKQRSSHHRIYYGCGIALVLPPIVGVVVRQMCANDVDAVESVDARAATTTFAITCVELISYVAAIVVYLRFARRQAAEAGRRTGSFLFQLFTEKYRVHAYGIVVVIIGFLSLDAYVAVFANGESVMWWAILAFGCDVGRAVLMLLYFLHFVPLFMHQLRKRALITAGVYLVCTTRLITYGLRVIGNTDADHPINTTALAMLDTLIILHVTAIGNAHFLRASRHGGTHDAEHAHRDSTRDDGDEPRVAMTSPALAKNDVDDVSYLKQCHSISGPPVTVSAWQAAVSQLTAVPQTVINPVAASVPDANSRTSFNVEPFAAALQPSNMIPELCAGEAKTSAAHPASATHCIVKVQSQTVASPTSHAATVYNTALYESESSGDSSSSLAANHSSAD